RLRTLPCRDRTRRQRFHDCLRQSRGPVTRPGNRQAAPHGHRPRSDRSTGLAAGHRTLRGVPPRLIATVLAHGRPTHRARRPQQTERRRPPLSNESCCGYGGRNHEYKGAHRLAQQSSSSVSRTVRVDDTGDVRHLADGTAESVTWENLAAVMIRVMPESPWQEDVFFMLANPDGTGTAVPSSDPAAEAL